MKHLSTYSGPESKWYDGPTFLINEHICPVCGEPSIYKANKELHDDFGGTPNCTCCGAEYEISDKALAFDFSKLALVTSNKDKLDEYTAMKIEGLSIRPGVDLDEVDADSKTVITYKAISAGKDLMVEDTSLFVEGADIGTNIRWNMNILDSLVGKKAVFEVWIGVNLGKAVALYKGRIEGSICKAPAVEGRIFGFDNNFIPKYETRTLHQLANAGLKDKYSARRVAIYNMVGEAHEEIIRIEDVPTWTGKYQG